MIVRVLVCLPDETQKMVQYEVPDNYFLAPEVLDKKNPQ
jgi:hypothetical protein